MHFLGLIDAQVRSDYPAQRLSRIDRGCPVDTAGDRCLWHVGGTAPGENDEARTWRRRLQAGRFGSGFKPRPKSDAGIREIPLAP